MTNLPGAEPRLETCCRIQAVEPLARGAYLLRFDRDGRDFEPGQFLNIGLMNEIDRREYSICSSLGDGWFEVLIKEVAGGVVSRRLRRLREGDALAIEGPFGFFTIDEDARGDGRFLFVATGTGVSPFRCFVRSFPGLDYRLLHGVRHRDEDYCRGVFDPERYTGCVSGDPSSQFHGRVTAWLRRNPIDPATLCYLCGNCDMIYEVFDILIGQEVPPNQIFAEVYF